MRRSDLAAGLAVLVAGALLAVAEGPAPRVDTSSQAPRSVPVTEASYACPSYADAEEPAATVVSAPLEQTPDGGGAATIATRQRSLVELGSRGATWTGRTPAVARGLRVSASGPLAAGLVGSVSGVVGSGLVSAPCVEPAAHWWFVGTASTSGRSAELSLANPTPGVAVVDLAFHGPQGPLDTVRGQGVALAPGETRSWALADLVAGARVVTVEVTTRQGEVSAWLLEQAQDATGRTGAELVPAAAEPRRRRVLTGVPTGPGEHVLAVTNPGDASTIARVELLGPQGAFTPTGVEPVRVPGRAVGVVRLPTGAFDGDVTGVRVSGDRPVTAALRSTVGPSGDHVFAAAAAPVVRAGTPVMPELDGTLVLTGAGRSAATVDVLTTGANGNVVDERTLDLRGGQTRTVPVRAAPRADLVQVRVSGSGQVVAAVLWARRSDADLVSGYPLSPLRVTVRRPVVRYELVPPR